jgi:hypothetical protein
MVVGILQLGISIGPKFSGRASLQSLVVNCNRTWGWVPLISSIVGDLCSAKENGKFMPDNGPAGIRSRSGSSHQDVIYRSFMIQILPVVGSSGFEHKKLFISKFCF